MAYKKGTFYNKKKIHQQTDIKNEFSASRRITSLQNNFSLHERLKDDVTIEYWDLN